MAVSLEERQAILAELEHSHEVEPQELPFLAGQALAAVSGAIIRKPPGQNIAVMAHVQAAANAMKAATGADSYGTYIGHSPTPERAFDAFTPVSSATLGNAMCAFALENWDRFGFRYMIYRQRIHWGPGSSWEGMADRGDNTQNHFDHGHFAFETKASGPVTPAPAPQPPASKEDQLFSKSPIRCLHLVSAHSGLLLTSASDKHMAVVTQQPADGSLNQRWMIVGHEDHTVSFVNRAGDLTLDRPDYKTEAGTFLQVARTEYNDAQRWSVEELSDGRRRLWAPGTNRCLDIHMGSTDPGAAVQLWYGGEQRWQRFDFAFTI